MQKYLSVRDAMTKMPISVGPNTLILECSKIMLKEDVGSLIIKEANILRGIVTEKDLVEKIIAKELDPKKTKVKEIMTKDVITIEPTKDIMQAIKIMTEKNIRRLPVVELDKLIGLLTVKDILKIQPEMFDIIIEKSRFFRTRNI